jgi:predicted transposase YbfD/YdcC
MKTEKRLRLADVFVSITDPRQAKKTRYDLVEIMVVAVSGVLAGADTFVEIEAWASEKLDWFRQYIQLEHGIPSHDTFGRLFGLIDPLEFEAAFRRWVGSVLPALGPEVVALDGKTSRRSGSVDENALHLVSAFAAGAGLVLGQTATAKKSNEKTALPVLLQTLALEGCIITIDAMGTQTNIAQTIRDKKADYVLAVKDNQATLAEALRDFFTQFKATDPTRTPHDYFEEINKDHGRLEVRRGYSFDQLDCLPRLERWPDLKSFIVMESERTVKGKTSLEHRYYISSLSPEAKRAAHAIRAHWRVENSLHWCLDVAFADDQMRARTRHAAHNLAVLKHITLNLIRLDPIPRKGGIKVRRLIAATSDFYRAHLFGLA